MNLNYAIFRSQPIMTINDLAQIDSHNKREKKSYKSNPDIRIEDSYKNIQLVPLVKKLDKRTNTERWTISKKQYIKDKIHLSQLQDKYHERLIDAGFDLERGIKKI